MKKPQWYRFQNAASDEVTLYIYDFIGYDPWTGEGVDAQTFVRELAAISARKIIVRINSSGGEVKEGIAIYNALQRHPAEIEVHVDGLAASCASVIAMAGNAVVMGTGAFLMIHDAWACCCGSADDLRSTADTLDKISGSIAGIYAKRTTISQDEIERMMDEETWLTAEESVAMGFADSVEDGATTTATYAFLNRFKHVPAQLARAQRRTDPPQTVRDVEQILRDAGCSNAMAKAIAAGGFKATTPDPRDEDGEMAELLVLLKGRTHSLAARN